MYNIFVFCMPSRNYNILKDLEFHSYWVICSVMIVSLYASNFIYFLDFTALLSNRNVIDQIKEWMLLELRSQCSRLVCLGKNTNVQLASVSRYQRTGVENLLKMKCWGTLGAILFGSIVMFTKNKLVFLYDLY